MGVIGNPAAPKAGGCDATQLEEKADREHELASFHRVPKAPLVDDGRNGREEVLLRHRQEMHQRRAGQHPDLDGEDLEALRDHCRGLQHAKRGRQELQRLQLRQGRRRGHLQVEARLRAHLAGWLPVVRRLRPDGLNEVRC